MALYDDHKSVECNQDFLGWEEEVFSFVPGKKGGLSGSDLRGRANLEERGDGGSSQHGALESVHFE